MESGEGGRDDWGGGVSGGGGECRQLYLNNNKIIKKRSRYFINGIE